jgi:monoamine oxidase
VAWTRVIAERRATYACTPGLARPVAGRLAPGIYLAGDYTDAKFPATLEAAVRSGHTAADALLAGLAGRRLEGSQGE